MRTLLLCYNRALARWLAGSLADEYAERIAVRHFHGLCREWCQRAGIRFSPPKRNAAKFWRDEAPSLLLDAVTATDDRFDAVVVDEGQDFHPDWWVPVEALNRDGDGGPLYVFYDPAQNLFVDGQSTLPALGRPFVLPCNCRNTRRIAETCGEFLGAEIQTRPEAPEGVAPVFLDAPNGPEQCRAIDRLVGDWIRRGKLAPRQICVLSPWRRERGSLARETEVGGVPLTEDLKSWERGDGILVTTIRAFKGLEADAVILVDVPAPDRNEQFTTTDLYVGCSRAKHLLAVIRREPFQLRSPDR